MYKAEAYAQMRGGKVIETTFGPDLTFECRLGHRWQVKSSKYAQSRWCATCASEEKANRT